MTRPAFSRVGLAAMAPVAALVAVTASAGVAAAQSSATINATTRIHTPEVTTTASSTTPSWSTTTSSSVASPTSSEKLPGAGQTTCPALQIVAVQGTGESSDQAATDIDSGMLGRVIAPAMLQANQTSDDALGRFYVPYAADFGFQGTPYSESMTGGVSKTEESTAALADRCPTTKFGIIGYSQGADIADQVLRKIGRGEGPIDADRLALGILFSSPARAAGESLFPGKDGQTHPDPVPGTNGQAVSGIDVGELPAPEGGGISPTEKTAGNYGDAAGRVMSFCITGDPACDTPEGAPLARVVANIAGQADLSDPIRALNSVGPALASTLTKTAGNVVNEDLQGDDVSTLQYSPKKSISQRLAEASDPRSPQPDLGQTLTRLGTIGLETLTLIAQKVLTVDTIFQVATVGLARPEAGLAILATKAVQAVGELVTPATANRWVKTAFTAVQENVEENADLARMVTDTNYWQSVQNHGGYASTASTPTGDSATQVATKWIVAAAADLEEGDTSSASPNTSAPRSTTTAPTFPSPTDDPFAGMSATTSH